jgi:hypothetical protein
VVAQRNIIDGRNALAPDRWREAGWEYRAPGVAAGPAKVRLGSETVGGNPVCDITDAVSPGG